MYNTFYFRNVLICRCGVNFSTQWSEPRIQRLEFIISKYCCHNEIPLTIGLNDSFEALKNEIICFVGNMFYCLEVNVTGDCEEKQNIVQI